jgi:hypothetical protein
MQSPATEVAQLDLDLHPEQNVVGCMFDGVNKVVNGIAV